MLSVQVYADTIVFTGKELDAAFTLTRPELNSIVLQGKGGTFDPSPSFQFLGIDPIQFDIDLGFIGDFVNLKFNQVRSKPFQVQFQDQGLLLSVPFQDQSKAIQCNLGSISLKGVTLMAVLGVKTTSQGQTLVIKNVLLNGQISGTGVLKGKLVLKKTKELLVQVLTKQINKILAKESTQTQIQSGLLTWSKFYNGKNYQRINPNTLTIDETGIRYDVD